MSTTSDAVERLAQLKQRVDELKQVIKGERKIHAQRYRDASPAEQLEMIWDLPEMPDQIFEELKNAGGFITGSSVYSDTKPEDIDWCVNMPAEPFQDYTIGNSSDYWDDDFASVKGHYKGQVINILCFGNYDLFLAWKRTTQTMVDTRCSEYNVKWKRVRVFRALVDVYQKDTRYTAECPKHPVWTATEARAYRTCRICGREAINFTTKAFRDQFISTGVCERCNPVAPQ